MSLLIKSKTNWKFILIVLILAILVGGGILGYLKHFEGEIDSLTKFSEIKNTEKVIEEETANWKTYRNEEYGLDFEYPKSWDNLTLKSEKNNEIFIFDTQNENIRTVLYHRPSENIIFIEQGKKRDIRGDIFYEKILKVIFLSNKEIRVIFNFNPLGIYLKEQYWDSVVKEHVEDFHFSPNGKYIAFTYPGWDFPLPYIIEIYSGTNILNPVPDCIVFKDEISGEVSESLECDVWYYETPKSVYWSSSSNVLAIRSFELPFGRGSPEGLFISDYGNPGKLKPIICWHDDPYNICNNALLNFSSKRPVTGDISDVFDIYFIYFNDEENLVFSVFFDGKTVKYEYNTKTNKLKEIK